MWPDVSRYERGDNVLLLPSGSSAATRGLEGLRKGAYGHEWPGMAIFANSLQNFEFAKNLQRICEGGH
jgi:hypothetical protein